MHPMQNDDPKPEDDISGLVAGSEEPSASDAAQTSDDEVARLLLAGFDEIREQGSVEPRVADIVRRAGLSNKAFYRHFRSKDELILAILEEGMRRRMQIFEVRLSEQASAVEKVAAWIRVVQEQALDPAYAEVTRPFCAYQARLTEELGEQLWAHTDYLRAPLEAALAQGVRAGEFRDLDPEGEAVIIYWLAMGWMQAKVLQRVVPTQAEAESVVEFVLRSILPSAAG
jgi:AcrR family transcriptional regulator